MAHANASIGTTNYSVAITAGHYPLNADESLMTVAFFIAAFLTLATLFWPYMIPYAITVSNAAAPDKSLSFLFWGAGLFVLPVIAIYTAVVYWVFRGKLHQAYGAENRPTARRRGG
jgi:cytochrome d ubiquinol oxidase subunit II